MVESWDYFIKKNRKSNIGPCLIIDPDGSESEDKHAPMSDKHWTSLAIECSQQQSGNPKVGHIHAV